MAIDVYVCFCVLYSVSLIHLSMLMHFSDSSVTMDLLCNLKSGIVIHRLACFPREYLWYLGPFIHFKEF